jgi:nucleotide-binding universal stress UspA family protein
MGFDQTAARLTDALSEVAAHLARPRMAAESLLPAGSPSEAPRPANGLERACPGLTIRHILVPLDGSALAECTLPFAAALGKVLSARITLLRVLMPPSGHVDPIDWELVRAEAHGQLARFERQLTASGLASRVAVLEGRPAEQIIHFAEEHRVDLIVLSSHGEGGITGWVLSSTAQKVRARAHSSILIVPAYVEGPRVAEFRFRKVLLPLDCSPRAECILPFAAALARAHDAELILAHVVPEPELPRRMPPSPEDVALARRLTERNRDESETYLRDLSRDLSAQGIRVQSHAVVSARRPQTILELAGREDVDLIVACAHGATANASERYGSTAAHLIQWSDRPIVVLQDLPGAVRESTRAEEAARSHAGH